MKIGLVLLFAALLVTGPSSFGLASHLTAPAFLWSPHLKFSNDKLMEETVNYQTILSKDLAKSVLSQGGWSNLLCSGEEPQHSLDLAIVFVGSELQSSDVSGSGNANPALVDLLKDSFTRSNFSMAFPYVAASEEERMENLLVSGFTETCGDALGVGNIVFSESCSLEDNSIQKLTGSKSLHDYIIARSEKTTKGKADLVIFCSGSFHSSKELDKPRSENEVLSEIISSAEQSGAKYAALYASDPYRYPSYGELQRFLSENAAGNGSANATTCDEVCQIKSSLLEGLLVGIVLLLILISGLCCMAGIDAPTRFETPQDS